MSTSRNPPDSGFPSGLFRFVPDPPFRSVPFYLKRTDGKTGTDENRNANHDETLTMTKLTNDARAIPEDRIALEHAQIYWNESDDPEGVCDVRIIDRRRVWADGRIDRAWSYCGGASWRAWGKPEGEPDDIGTGNCHLTPEGVFGTLCAAGFKNRAELHRAIYEFARIEGQTWAQRMLRGLGKDQEDAARSLPDPVKRMRRAAA